MSDRGNALPEAPDNWGEYSRILGDLPLRSLPSGADGRLQARLEAVVLSPRPSRPWLVGGLSLAGCCLAVIAGLTVFAPDDRPASIAPARPPIVSEEKTKRRSVRRPQPTRQIAPQVGETAVTIDTNIPRHIPLDQRQPQVTTGIDRREARPGSTPHVTVPRTQPRTAP